MKIFLNGLPQDFEVTATVQDALAVCEQAVGPFAVALNREFLPRSLFAHTPLQEGDHLDLVVPMQGG